MNNPEQISPENVESFQHREWLAQPMTQKMLKHLDTHRERFVSSLGANSSVEDTEALIRSLAASIKTIDALKKLITDTETFINYNKQS